MPDDPSPVPGATPSNYRRTTGGNLQWKPPSVEHLQQLLSGYEVIEMLGAGGMGAVYKARQISLDRMVAIKILPPEAAGDEEANFVERFRNEARTMAKMNHPAIVSVYDFGETSEGQLYIVMEFVDGTDVSKMILSQGKLPQEYALAITAHVCDALQYAHTHGVIHRDIKPANVLINMEGAVKVADFGLAKGTDAGQGGLTKTNMAMGTPDFVAPEALIAGMTVDGRADLYAVGVMLYNMLTGNVPRGMFRMPSTTLNTDPRFDKIITKSMEMDREMRYQTAFDVRKDLDVILSTPRVEAGGQSSAAIPKQQLPQKPVAKVPQKPVAKVPQKPMGKSAKVPVRSSQGNAGHEVAEQEPGQASASVARRKSIIGPILGITATVVIGAGLFFMFTGGSKPDADAAASSNSMSSAAGDISRSPNPLTDAPAALPSPTVESPAVTKVDATLPAPSGEPSRIMTPASTPPAGDAPTAVGSTVAGAWRYLFDGSTLSGWTAQNGTDPATAWKINGRELSSDQRTLLWSPESYGDYELELEWKMGLRGNGGVFYHVQGSDHLKALEMQLCDPANAGGVRSGGLYGIQSETHDASKPVFQWNTAKLVVRGTTREHWINGEKVCAYDVSSDEFRRLADASKNKPDISTRSGRIVLQANGGPVFYRNVKLRTSDAELPALTSAPVDSAGPAVASAPANAAPVVPAAMVPTIPPPAPGPPAASTAPPPSNDPRLAQLAAGFKARYEADAQKPFLAAVATLNQSYVANGIGRARAAAQQKGTLEEVTALDAEKARIQNGQPLPPADLETLPASLKGLRATYRGALAKIEADRAQKAAPLYDLYIGALNAYVTELTKANKIDAAQKVKTLRDDIAAQKPQVDAAEATPASRPAPGNTKTAKAQGIAPAPGRSRWHEAARWVVSVGGFVNVDNDGRQIRIEKVADIPPGKFEVLDVSIDANPQSNTITDDDFTRLSGLKELRSFRVAGIKVGDAAFAFLPATPAVTSIVIAGIPVTDAVLSHVAPLANLGDLQVQSAPQFTGAGLEKLASLPVLKSVWFSGSGFNDAGARALARAPNLEFARFDSSKITDDGVAALGRMPRLTDVSFMQCEGVRGTGLAQWEGVPALRALHLSSTKLNPDALPFISRLSNLTTLGLDSLSVMTDETLAAFAPLKRLEQIAVTATSITGTGFTSLRGCTQMKSLFLQQDTPVSGEGLAAIAASFPKLEDLRLGRTTALNGTDLHPLATLKYLKQLYIALPNLDEAGMKAIGQISPLETLNIDGVAIPSQSIASLKPLKLLTRLVLINSPNIDDSAIPALKDLKALTSLEIRGTAITDAGMAALQKAMPRCQISR